jgi:hypothetical protein
VTSWPAYARPVNAVDLEPWHVDPRLDALLGRRAAALFRTLFDG